MKVTKRCNMIFYVLIKILGSKSYCDNEVNLRNIMSKDIVQNF